MIFRRKKKEKGARGREQASAADGQEARRFYRRAPGKKHALSVKVRGGDGRLYSGELVDVSAGGAAVAFSALAPTEEVGDQVVLRFSSLIQKRDIETTARVVRRSSEQSPAWGFRFDDVVGLFNQLDTYFVKFFNRRRAIRVQTALDTKVTVLLHTPAGELQGRLANVSVDGVGVTVDPAVAGSLGGVDMLDVEFTIPKVKVVIPWHAHSIHVTVSPRGTMFGARFDPQPSKELKGQMTELTKYVEKRVTDMARWDSA